MSTLYRDFIKETAVKAAGGSHRLAQVLAKLPPVPMPKPLPPIRMPSVSEREFDAMRKHFREALWQAQNGKCAACGLPFSRTHNATFDHVQPLSRAGANWIGNLLLMHPACNVKKGDSSPSRELREKLDAVNIYLRTIGKCAHWFETKRRCAQHPLSRSHP